MNGYPFNVKDVVRQMREDCELTTAWMNEKVSVEGTLDYRFFHQYFETLSVRLHWLEDLL